MTVIRENLTVQFPAVALTGTLVSEHYTDGTPALSLYTDEGPEHLSVNLVRYGLAPRVGSVFVPDYSEHEGVADSLVSSGLITKVRKVTFGDFGTSAWEVALNKEIDLAEVLGSGNDLEIVYDEVISALHAAHPIFAAAYQDDEDRYGDLSYAITDLDERSGQSVDELREAVEGYLTDAAKPFGITFLT